MAIANEITRLNNAANILKNKSVELGLKKDDGVTLISKSDKLDVQARAFDRIEKISVPNVELTSSQQKIECKGKMIDNDIIIPSVNLFYTGDDVPNNDFGNNGDLFLVI